MRDLDNICIDKTLICDGIGKIKYGVKEAIASLQNTRISVILMT